MYCRKLYHARNQMKCEMKSLYCNTRVLHYARFCHNCPNIATMYPSKTAPIWPDSVCFGHRLHFSPHCKTSFQPSNLAHLQVHPRRHGPAGCPGRGRRGARRRSSPRRRGGGEGGCVARRDLRGRDGVLRHLLAEPRPLPPTERRSVLLHGSRLATETVDWMKVFNVLFREEG